MPDIDHCPECGEPSVLTCRCFRRDSTCKNGHYWHLCVLHQEIVAGPSDHKKDILACTCGRDVQVKITDRKIELTREIRKDPGPLDVGFVHAPYIPEDTVKACSAYREHLKVRSPPIIQNEAGDLGALIPDSILHPKGGER